MMPEELALILEALLFSSTIPLTIDAMCSAFEEQYRPTKEQLTAALAYLQASYETRAVELKELATGYCFQTKLKYAPWIQRLQTERPQKYSRALIETLAIIAYQQPVTRADIEEIRGVCVSPSILKTLLERQWVQQAGCRDLPGKPALYQTTPQFLDYFNLSSLDELPQLKTNGLID